MATKCIALRNFATANLIVAFACAVCVSSAVAADTPADRIHPALTPLDAAHTRHLAKLSDGRLIAIAQGELRASADDGKTWKSVSKITCEAQSPLPTTGLLATTKGDEIVVVVYVDDKSVRWKWDDQTNEPLADSRRDVWSIRSTDGGQTWTDPQMLLKGYCGALVDILVARSGAIVVPVQRLLYEPGRHATATYVSTDAGKTWRESNLIDIGGHGHHDGAFEATLVQRSDDTLWMLLRTNHDCFYQAVSTDDGLTWRDVGPTQIDASSSPGKLLGLSDGRMVLVWNRLYETGATSAPRRGLPYSQAPGSWHRKELSLAVSGDDGKTWSEPVVIARGNQSYPALFESKPGELWLSCKQLWHRFRPDDLVPANP